MIQDIYKLHWNIILISLFVGCWSFMVNTLFSCNVLFIFNKAEKKNQKEVDLSCIYYFWLWRYLLFIVISHYGDKKNNTSIQTSLLHLQNSNLFFFKLNDNSLILRSFSESSFKNNNNPLNNNNPEVQGDTSTVLSFKWQYSDFEFIFRILIQN